MANIKLNVKLRPGIYKITNTSNGKVYIGQSGNIPRRIAAHKAMLNGNRHDCTHLQNAWNKYGSTSFIFETVEEITEELSIVALKQKLVEREYLLTKEYQEAGILLYNTVINPSMSSLGIAHPGLSERSTGENNPAAKLTEQQAIALLTTDKGLSYEEASVKYNVTESCLKDLWLRRSWGHLAFPKVLKPENITNRSGENHPLGQLKESEAIAILTTDANLTVNECCEKYKVNRIVIEQLRARNTWKHLNLPAVHTKAVGYAAKGSNNGNSKLNDDLVKQIKDCLAAGQSCMSIGKKFNVSNVTIANIKNGKIWKHV